MLFASRGASPTCEGGGLALRSTQTLVHAAFLIPLSHTEGSDFWHSHICVGKENQRRFASILLKHILVMN